MDKLWENARIGIIGGGPAGAFCANFLLYYSSKENFPIQVTIYEGKVFEVAGVKGCNLCVGILAHSLLEKLSSLGLEVPPHIIQRRIDSYRLITEIGDITLERDEKRRIYTVYRGGGPRGFKFVESISFDNFLLSTAVKRGALLRKCTITDVEIPRARGAPYVLKGECGRKYNEDIIVGAFGVNSHLKKAFESLGIGYRSPRTTVAYQGEFNLGEDFITENIENTVLVYLLPIRKLDFGLIAPKRAQVTVSIVGRGLKKGDVDSFLGHPLVKQAFPNNWAPHGDYCYCAPHLPVTPAVKPYADRMVIIGDASISRYYKNGIQSAYFTALFAAKTMFYRGIGAGDFMNHYWRECRNKYFYDNLYGKALFFCSLVIKRSRYLSRIMLNVASGRWAIRAENAMRLQRIYWNMFTGNAPYYYILKDLLDAKLQSNILRASFFSLLRKKDQDG